MRAFVLVAFVLAGCRSIDPERYALAQRELAKREGATRAVAPPPAPGTPVPVPWSKGQYAVWAVTAGKTTTLLKAQVEEANVEGAVLLFTTLSPKLRTTAKLTFRQQPHTLDEARELLTQVVRKRGDDRELTYRFHSEVRPELRDALRPLWATLVPQPREGDPENASVTAGTLQGCTHAVGLFAYTVAGTEMRGLVHPGVPINGLVKAEALEGKETIELMEMGWSGGGPQF